MSDGTGNIKKKPMLGEAEWEIMTIIWEEGRPLTSTFIMEHLAGRAWALSTVMTVLARLCNKGFVHCDRSGGLNQYTAVISGAEYRERESQAFLKKAYGNSIANMVAALTDSGAVSDEEIDRLREILNRN
ncbi:MAG: BlaI/MecI/CopY family transcriptional regulator [Peptococcaceae bacterium]|jgi:predicted transcriptional regulator|nr:BlaI/MecI/CopY family transcriptional regulator [Peptococcaceae bacterium]